MGGKRKWRGEVLKVTIPLGKRDLGRVKREMERLLADEVGLERSLGVAYILHGLDVLISEGVPGPSTEHRRVRIRGGGP